MHDLGLLLLTMVTANPLPAGAIVGSSLLMVLAFKFPRSGLN